MEDLFCEFRAWLGATAEELGGLSPQPGRAVTESKSCRKPRWAEVEWRVVFQNLNTVYMKQLLLLMPATPPAPPSPRGYILSAVSVRNSSQSCSAVYIHSTMRSRGVQGQREPKFRYFLWLQMLKRYLENNAVGGKGLTY